MKKITLTIIGILFCHAAFAQEPIVPDYLNNFALPSDLWSYGNGMPPDVITTVDSNDWNYFDYANQSDGSHGFAAYINIKSADQPTNQWFISPLFNLSGGTYYLNFDIALTQFADTTPATFSQNEFVAFMISEDNGGTWTEMLRWDQNSAISNLGESIAEITLEITGNAQFGFYASSDVGSAGNIDFFADNFSITQNSLGTVKNELSQFKFYPNPVTDVLHVSNTEAINDITVFNMLGQQVMYTKINATQSTLDLSGLVSGNYIAKVATPAAVKTIKLIKQ